MGGDSWVLAKAESLPISVFTHLEPSRHKTCVDLAP